MATYFTEPSRTFGEYLLVPGYSSSECIPSAVSLKTPLVKYRKGQEDCPLSMNIPMVSAIMQSVSNDTMAIALAKEGGVSFIYGSQSVEDEAAMVARVKSYKKGFIVSDSNVRPDATLADILALKEKTGHSTVAVTDDGTANGKLLGIVASRDYRISRMSTDLPVSEFMTPFEKLVVADEDTTLKEANDIIWDNKINSLPLIDKNQHLKCMVFRKDYDSHKENVNELLDKNKSYIVGAGINTRDYAERVPALVDVKIGLDVLPGVVVIVQAGERVLAGALHQFVVTEFPVGDVQKNADVNPFTVLVRGQATFFQSPDQIAVGFSDPVFLLVIVALRVRAGRRDAPAVIGVDDAGQLAAAGLFKLLAGVAEQGEQAVADIGQRSSGLGAGDEGTARDARTDQGHEVLLALVDGVAAFLFLNVRIEAVNDVVAVVAFAGLAAVQTDAHALAVFFDEAAFDGKAPLLLELADAFIRCRRVDRVHDAQ